jgi:hypothetical protein
MWPSRRATRIQKKNEEHWVAQVPRASTVRPFGCDTPTEDPSAKPRRAVAKGAPPYVGANRTPRTPTSSIPVDRYTTSHQTHRRAFQWWRGAGQSSAPSGSDPRRSSAFDPRSALRTANPKEGPVAGRDRNHDVVIDLKAQFTVGSSDSAPSHTSGTSSLKSLHCKRVSLDGLAKSS